MSNGGASTATKIRRSLVRWLALGSLISAAPIIMLSAYPPQSSQQLAFVEWVNNVSARREASVVIELREYKPGHNSTFFSVKGTSDSPKVQRLIELARDAELFRGDVLEVGQAAKVSGDEPEVEVVIKGAGAEFLHRANSDEFERQIQAKVFKALMGEFGG
jgi:hypothetical protein